MATILLFIVSLISLWLLLRAAAKSLLPTLRLAANRTRHNKPTAEDYETYLNAMEAAFKTARLPTLPRSPRKPRNPKPKDKVHTDNANPNDRTVPKNTSPHKSPPIAESQISVHSRPLAVKNDLSNIRVNACSSVVLSPSKPKQILLTLCLAPLRVATCLARMTVLTGLVMAVFAIGLFARRRQFSAGSQTQSHAA